MKYTAPDYQDSADRFARDTGPRDHQEYLPHDMLGPRRLYHDRPHAMTVRHDEGLYRHLLFKSPDHSGNWFELITAPHVLIFRGDGDSFVFSRAEDMFEFFRDSGWDKGINPQYWAQKLTNAGGPNTAESYSPENFKAAVWDHVRQYGKQHRGLAKAVQEHFFDDYGDWNTEDEHAARDAMDHFRYGGRFVADCSCRKYGRDRIDVSDELEDTVTERYQWLLVHKGAGHEHNISLDTPGFRFNDSWEWSFKEFDWWFLWACQAIYWGIGQYQAAKGTPDRDATDVLVSL